MGRAPTLRTSFFDELRRRNVLRVAAAYAVAAWLIIQIAETIFPLFGFDETPARIVVVVLAIGFVPSLIFAWVFEITPEGLKREKDVDRSKSIAPQTGRRLDRLIIIVLALGLTYFAFDKFVVDPLRERELEKERTEAVEKARQEGRTQARIESYGEKSIAVLPFTDMSALGDQQYLADGIAEELLNLLADIPELRVISRTSAFSFRGENLAIPEIAKRLNVAHILEGSVRSSGDNIRITAQLIDAELDTHLWSESWDSKLEDIFAIQDRIAAKVVEGLKLSLLGQMPTVHETDPEAYKLYLQARQLNRQGSRQSRQIAIDLCERALAIDPQYVNAWLVMASAYSNLTAVGALPFEEGFAKMREAIEQALAIDGDNGEAHAVLAWYYDAVGNYPESARLYTTAMRLAPNDINVLNGVGSLLQTLGRHDEEIAINERLVDRDPINPILLGNLGQAYFYAKRYDEAMATFEKTLLLSPTDEVSRFFIGLMAYVSGDCETTLQVMERLAVDVSDPSYRLFSQALCYPEIGRQADGNEALERFQELYGNTFWSGQIAGIHALQGRPDKAFEWLEHSYATHGSNGLYDAAQYFMFVPLHDDPRWKPLLEKAGVSRAQLDAIDLEVELPEYGEQALPSAGR